MNYSKVLFLSYPVMNNSPRYGDSGKLSIKHVRQISRGDTSNNSELSFSAHIGTHIDAPYHFSEQGWKINDFSPEFWICTHPYIINYNAKPGEIINNKTILNQLDNIPKNCDLLILKTNFFKNRNNKELYIFNNPGIDPEIGVWLRKNTNIKMIGFDFISLSSYQNRELGRKAHLAFLDNLVIEDNIFNPILIIEDMDLSSITKCPSAVIVSPLRYESADGSPVTVMALYE